jgi:agmatinase
LQAIAQIEEYTKYLLNRPIAPGQTEPKIPQLITLGGDHTVLLPVVRAMAEAHGRPINVIHFDSHLDTWSPEAYGIKPPSLFNHGNPLYHAAKEGLIANGTSMHVGIRSSLYDSDDFEKDEALGFRIIKANDIFDIGVDGIIARMHEFLGPKEDAMVYLSIDIDVIDPSAAPGTGTLKCDVSFAACEIITWSEPTWSKSPLHMITQHKSHLSLPLISCMKLFP